MSNDKPREGARSADADVIEQATEKSFGQLMVREGLRHRGMSTQRNDWASEAWDEVKNELDDAQTRSAMEVAETMAHAQVVIEGLLTNVATARTQFNAALDAIEADARVALDGVTEGYLADVKLWPSLQALSRVMGVLRANESILTAGVESTFRSFYETAAAIKRVRGSQERHEKLEAADGEG
jgi:hypothetical protein